MLELFCHEDTRSWEKARNTSVLPFNDKVVMTMPCPADQAAAGTGIAAWITNRGTSVRVVGACSGATVNASQIPDSVANEQPNPKPRLVLARQSGPSSADYVLLERPEAVSNLQHACRRTCDRLSACAITSYCIHSLHKPAYVHISCLYS